MSDTISPNMGLVIPGVGTEPSPTWATDLNSSLTILDAHNHSTGNGVQITPTGLNLNSDLPFNGNNQTLIRSSRYSIQGSPLSGALDLGCVYVSGVDLYFNDENGNQIQITKDGGIAGTSGSIANLTSPASASYVSGTSTFVWQSDANTAANMDNASVTIRKLAPSSPGVTLSAPSSLSGNYTITFPLAPPSSLSLVEMDNSGNLSLTRTPSIDAVIATQGNFDMLVVGSAGFGGSGDLNASGNITANGNVTGTNVIASTGNLDATSGNVNTQTVNASVAVNPGGLSNASVVSGSPTGIEITNQTSSVSLPVVVGDGVGAIYTVILAGGVDSTGARINGGNFTSVRNTLGNYTVTYGTNLFNGSNIPVVVATSAGLGGSPTIAKPLVSQSFVDHCIIIMHDGGGSNVDCGFNFVAYGGRGN